MKPRSRGRVEDVMGVARSRRVLCLGIVLALIGSARGWAQVPAGGEIRVNTYTTGSQFGPIVARAADGRFVVVWYSESDFTIRGQRFDAAGSRLGGGRTGLVYLDMHADLNVPSSVVDGALDWMGMAHMLGVAGCLPELADLASPFAPMLDPSQVVVLGHERSQATDWELSAIAEWSVAVVAAEALRSDPAAAARHALAQLADATRVIVHLDVDVVDFVDAPLSENTGRNVGVPLAAVAAALPVLMADRRAAALTVTELNPVHAAADPGCLGRLVDALVAAIS